VEAAGSAQAGGDSPAAAPKPASDIELEAKKLQDELKAKNDDLDRKFLESVKIDLEERKKARLNPMQCG
jgi:hypothetical protein